MNTHNTTIKHNFVMISLRKVLAGMAALMIAAFGAVMPSSAASKTHQLRDTVVSVSTVIPSTADTITLTTKQVTPPVKVTVIHPAWTDPAARYPVVYMLNGYGGDYRSWPQGQPRLNELAQEKGIIIVCPDGRDSWYWDSPVDPNMQMETLITRVLVPMIDANYPTIADPAHRAITGLSMGGHGALWLAMRHPDLFGSMGSMSGGVNIIPFTKKWKMEERLGPYDENVERWEEHTVINLVPTLAPGQNIIIDCGVDDFFAEVNNELHEALLARKIPHDYTSRPGKHSWDYWRNSILYHLEFFSEAFRKASAK